MQKQSLEDRFWRKVEKTSGCWHWTSAIGSSLGYGVFWIGNGRSQYAHRVSWELAHKIAPPQGMVIMHSCDNPICVNPDHLKLGTSTDNIRDCMKKGRHAVGERNGGRKIMTFELATEIRKSCLPHRQLAKMYGIGKATVGHIKHGRIWKESNSFLYKAQAQ